MHFYKVVAHSLVASVANARYEVWSTPLVDLKRQERVDRELDKAGRELARGDSISDSGRPDRAFKHYERAYSRAEKALKHFR